MQMSIKHDSKISFTCEDIGGVFMVLVFRDINLKENTLLFNKSQHKFFSNLFPDKSWGLTVVLSAEATASKLCLSVGWLTQRKIGLQTHWKPIVGVDRPLSSHFCIPLLAHADTLQYIWALRAKIPRNACVYWPACLKHIEILPTSVTLVLQNIECTSNKP